MELSYGQLPADLSQPTQNSLRPQWAHCFGSTVAKGNTLNYVAKMTLIFVWDCSCHIICFTIQKLIKSDILQENTSCSSVPDNLFQGRDNTKQNNNGFMKVNAVLPS
jgi:hypothetical protein